MSPLDTQVSALMRRVAAEIVMPHFGKLAADEIMEKAPDDLVTIADRESEIMLAAGLTAILPDASVLGEEAAAADPSLLDRVADDLLWIIDPIDGTHNYAHGRPPFGIMVALAEGGETVAGWILDPVTGRMCHAARGGGAWIDGERVKSRETGSEPPLFALSLMFLDDAARADVAAIAQAHYTLVDIPRCAAEQYPRLVLGANDVARFERTLPWDHAAGALFLHEAGGVAARLDGTPYRPSDRRSGMIGAASPRLWEQAARIMTA